MSAPACWWPDVRHSLGEAELEIALMLLYGPEAEEYTDQDIWRSMVALDVDVTLDEVGAHRGRRCGCYWASRKAEAV